MTDMMNMTVTTLDLHTGYEVVGPVCGSCRQQSDPDQGFLQALREIRKSAALLQADAVIGMRQTCVPMADGTGRFHVQLYGTAVRKTAQAQADADGGAAANSFLMQFQSDISDVEIVCPECGESTALGAAFLAGLAVGFWKDREEIKSLPSSDRKFTPKILSTQREELLSGWKNAINRTVS